MKSLIARSVRTSIHTMARYRVGRRALNAAYMLLPTNRLEWVHSRYSRLFRGESFIIDDEWRLSFAGRPIVVPLRNHLDWEIALSILGHDVDVKRAYLAAITSTEPPDIFIDIGANVGLHSLLFLLQGIDTISFEPQPFCQQYIKALCSANAVVPKIEPYCLGQTCSFVDLTVPAEQHDETWLASVKVDVASSLEQRFTVNKQRVEQRTLDSYLPTLSDYKRPLIKIDVEGAEADVLRGATETIRKFQPTILFEANGDREELFSIVEAIGYSIVRINTDAVFSMSEFISERISNFACKPNRLIG